MTQSLLPSLFGKSERPFFQSLHKEIDRVFDEFRELNPWDDAALYKASNGKLVPKLDVSETEKEIEISAELPGVKMDDIDISVTDNVLTLKGEKSAESRKDEKDYHLVERSYGSFLRTIPLSFAVDSKEVKADFVDGILKISIKKPPEIAAKTQKIKISKSA